MENVEWFTVPKFPGYEINERLEVRRKSTGRVLCCHSSDGYLKVNITHLGKDYKPYLHQLVAWVFVPNPENKPEIHHVDCDPLNNHWDNLQWVTKAEHRALSKQNGQVAHKLTHADVMDIRNNYCRDAEIDLAVKYGVKPLTIYLIATGQARSDVHGGVIHEKKGSCKKVLNIKTGEVYKSIDEVSVKEGIDGKKIRRGLSGERYNNTDYRYLGEEYKSRQRPPKIRVIPFVSYSFGVIVPKRELIKSKNSYAKWKRVVQFDLMGNKLAEYKSIREAARAVGGSDHKQLQKLLNGRRGSTYKRCIWEYA